MMTMSAARGTGDDVCPTLRLMALDRVCFCLASADSVIKSALFARFSSSPAGAADGGMPSPPRDGEGGVGLPPSIGDLILKRAAETGFLTDQAVLELLRWCTPRSLCLNDAPLTVTDSLLVRYPTEACAELEEVRLGWSPHLQELDEVLLHIRKTGIDGQEDEPCALRVLDVSGHENLSDGILKALAGRCPALTFLAVDGCASLDGSFLERLAKGCPALSTLSTDACTGLTDSALSNFLLESAAVSNGTLRCLRLGCCSVGALTCQALMLKGGHLRVLNLDGCSGLGDAAVRMVCRSCPQLVELSLLGCSKLTCRGAWQCTQHPTIETLSITLHLEASPEAIPPEDEKPKRGRGGGGSGARAGVSPAHQRVAADHDDARHGRGVTARATSCGQEQWACDRCTLLNPERRSVCQACRTPRGVITPPRTLPPPAPLESIGTSPPLSPSPLSSPTSSSPNSSVSPGRGTPRRRGRRERQFFDSEYLSIPPFPLPPVPPMGPLRRLRLELAPAPSTKELARITAVEAAGGGTASISLSAGGNDEGPAAAATDGPNGGSLGNASVAGAIRGASSPRRSKGIVFPLRRLAPLLPPTMTALDVRSCNAPFPPSFSLRSSEAGAPDSVLGSGEPPLHDTHKFVQDGASTIDGSSWASRRGAWREGGRGYVGERAPAFEYSTGSETRSRTRDGSPDNSMDWGQGVDVSASPGDLAAILEFCPVLQELAICGNPDPRVARAPVGARIRGRGTDALATSVLGGMHATAAALAYSFRHHIPSSGRDGKPDTRRSVSTRSSAIPSSSLRSLTFMDCPALPPLAVLEALSVELKSCADVSSGRAASSAGVSGGWGLEHVALGYSTPPLPTTAALPTSNLPVPPAHAAVSRSRRHWSKAPSVDRVGRVTEEEDGAGVGLVVEEGEVCLSSHSLESVVILGEGELAGLVLSRFRRLRRLHIVQCRQLRALHIDATPVLVDIRAEDCCLGNKALSSLARNCWGCKVLDVSGNDSVGDEVLESALACCPRLQSLRMNGCRAVGNSSRASLLSHLLDMRSSLLAATPTIGLSGCSPSRFQSLEELAISHAPKFTGAHFVALAGALPRLRRLSITQCRGFTQAALTQGPESREEHGTEQVEKNGGDGDSGPEELETGKTPVASDSETEQKNDSERGDKASRAEGYDVEVFRDSEGTCHAALHMTPDACEDDGGANEHDFSRSSGGGTAGPVPSSVEGAVPRGSHDENMAEGDSSRGAWQDRKSRKKTGGRRRRKEAVNPSVPTASADGPVSSAQIAVEADENSGTDTNEKYRGRSKGGAARKSKNDACTVNVQKSDGGSSRLLDAVATVTWAETSREAGVAGGKRGRGGKRVRGKPAHEDEGENDEDVDVCQGLEFTVDGKTRAKLERLAAALPREPGKKQLGRPSCIRFLQGNCPRSARDCQWAHIPMHPPKTLKFKPLITYAHEASSAAPSSRLRDVQRAPRAATGRVPASSASNTGSAAATITVGAHVMVPVFGDAESHVEGAVFPSLQFLDIHDCPKLETLHGLQCPALAVMKVTCCRELISMSIDAPLANWLDLSGCVRIEPWDLSKEGNGSPRSSLRDLQVSKLNYCRVLTARFLASLVDHARNLKHLEIYGAAVVVGPHGHHAEGSSRGKKEWSGGRRDLSRADYNRIHTKTTALLKSLGLGRPKLNVVRTKKDFVREHEGIS